MNNFELLPTEENLIKTLQDNLLKRNKDIEHFYNLLSKQEVSSSIAIDGRWGSGKTFFVKQTMLLINAKNESSNMDQNKKERIISSFSSQEDEETLKNNGIAIYYDAWENDNDTDPVLSLIYEITKQLEMNYKFNNINIFKLACSVLETITGRNISGIMENLRSENPLKKITEEKNLDEGIKQFFTELLKERGNRLVVFIDELDRCKPTYAVQLLERIKHYLCDDRITFVFSINMEELQHTIKHYYGNSFDACRYLDRFFDMRMSLPPGDKIAFYREIGLISSYTLEKVCLKVINIYNLELREASRFYCQVKTAVYEPTHNGRNWNFSFSDGKARQLMLLYIVPVCVGVKFVDVSLYSEFMNGANSKPLMDIYKDSIEGKWLTERLLNEDETLDDGTRNKKVIKVEQKLQELYDAIFVTEYTNGRYHTILGDYEFDCDSKAFVKKVESALSEYANYQI